MARERVSFADFCESWQLKVLPMWKPSSALTAKMHIRRYLLPAFGQMRLSDVNTETVQGFISDMVGKGAGRHYVLNMLGTLNSILTAAVKWGHKASRLDRFSLTLPPEGERQRGRTFTPDQVRAIITAAEEPERTLWATAALTGLRSGELAGLMWEDIDLVGQVLTVNRSCFRGAMQSVKSKAGNRTVPIPPALMEMLIAHGESQGSGPGEGLVFRAADGGPINTGSVVQRHLAPLLKRLGIPRAGLHAFRHAQASALVQTGANVKVAQQQLGHSKIQTTIELYTHIIGDEQRKAVAKASELLYPSDINQGRKFA